MDTAAAVPVKRDSRRTNVTHFLLIFFFFMSVVRVGGFTRPSCSLVTPFWRLLLRLECRRSVTIHRNPDLPKFEFSSVRKIIRKITMGTFNRNRFRSV